MLTKEKKIKFIENYLKKRKNKKISKRISRLQEQAMIYQRNGNLRGLSDIMNQISILEKEINDEGRWSNIVQADQLWFRGLV